MLIATGFSDIEIQLYSSVDRREEFWNQLPRMFRAGVAGVCLAVGLEYPDHLLSQTAALRAIRMAGTHTGLRVATTRDILERLSSVHGKELSRAIDVLIATNDAVMAEAVGFPSLSDKTFLLPNPTDSVRFSPPSPQLKEELRKKHNLPMQKKVLLWAGRYCSRKAPELALQLWKALEEDSAMLWLVGHDEDLAGEYDRLVHQLASHLHLTNVRFTSWLPESAIHEAYQASDGLLLTSLREGQSNAALEAACVGTPVVAFPIPGVSELAREFGEAAFFLADSKLPAALLRCIRHWLKTSPALRTPNVTALYNHSPAHVAASYLKILCRPSY